MSYLVLARKWRPMSFEDLVGQDHVRRTLANAIQAGRVAHAFLFTGVRGVGKTTSARILAKALNCMGDPEKGPKQTHLGPTSTPCLKCSACLEIAQGTDMDVREIDGASYTGVDDVRKLQDSIPYRPNRDRYKIFIVDEVHMLSQNAWNAFLKTLEEPPAHVKFIFATTEVHKVPETILSRVQRFDFKLISAQVIANRLAHVLQQERIQADESAIAILAREAAGSMRDAMSLLDQVIAWGGGSLKGEDVARVLGVASHQVLYDLTSALVGADAAQCLSIIAELADLGYDLCHVAKDTLGLLRNLVVAKVCPEPRALLQLPDQEAQDVEALAQTANLDDLIRLHQGFAGGFDEVVRSGHPRSALEMLLVRLARRPPLVPLDALVGRLSELERRLAGAPRRTASAPRPHGPPSNEPSAPGLARPRPRDPRPSSTPSSPESSSDDPGEPPPSDSGGVLTLAPSIERAEPDSSLGDAQPQPSPIPSQPSGQSETLPADLDGLLRTVLERVAVERPELAAKLEHAVPLEFSAGRLLLGWAPGNVFAQSMSGPEPTRTMERAAAAVLGAPTRVLHETDSERAGRRKTLSRLEAEEREERTREAYQRVREHPRIAEATEILGAKLKDLKLARQP